MIREVLFRGKATNTGEWVYSMTISKGTIKRKSSDYFFEIAENKWVGVLKETVGQYTGLKDKNGEMIFEDDILNYETNHYNIHRSKQCVVRFEDDIQNDSFGEPHTSGYCIYGFNWQVIGNIHDNSELINK